METIIKKLIFILFFLFSLPTYASENEFQKGYDLAKQGKYLEAFKVWKPLAEKGNDLAQYSLGVMYRDSLGIEQNYKLAEKWTRLSAEQGNPTAAFNLAHIYELGLGLEKDFSKAMKWYDLASLDFKKIDIIIEKVRNIRSSDMVCENKKLCMHAYRIYRKAAVLGYTNTMVYMSNIILFLPEKKYISDAVMWMIVADQVGIKDPKLKKNNTNVLNNFKENNLDIFNQSQDLANECVKSRYKNCGLYNKEIWQLVK